MSVATNLVNEVRAEGGELIPLDNGKLHIEAPNPLSEHLMDRLKQEKAEVVNFLTYRNRLLNGWDSEMAGLIEWFLTIEPPSHPFEISRAIVIQRPDKWWASLCQDISEGPSGPRAYHGALQGDLRRLAAYFTLRCAP